MPASKSLRYRPETRLVHAGQIRSELGETSETLFLTQSFVYTTAEECAARFGRRHCGLLRPMKSPAVGMLPSRAACVPAF